MNALSNVAIVAVIFITCYKLLEVLIKRKERLNIIDKLSEVSKIDNSNVLDLLNGWGSNMRSGKFISLRIGCALMGIGLGILVAFIFVRINFGFVNGSTDWYVRDIISSIYGASTMLFGGLALILCYIIERKEHERGK